MNNKVEPKQGDLQIWWVPQVPMTAFNVSVTDVEMGVKLLEVLGAYDLFQLKHNIKPDFCNVGGLQRWCLDSDGEGTPGWEDWYDEDTGEDNPATWVAEKSLRAASVKTT